MEYPKQNITNEFFNRIRKYGSTKSLGLTQVEEGNTSIKYFIQKHINTKIIYEIITDKNFLTSVLKILISRTIEKILTFLVSTFKEILIHLTILLSYCQKKLYYSPANLIYLADMSKYKDKNKVRKKLIITHLINA